MGAAYALPHAPLQPSTAVGALRATTIAPLHRALTRRGRTRRPVEAMRGEAEIRRALVRVKNAATTDAAGNAGPALSRSSATHGASAASRAAKVTVSVSSVVMTGAGAAVGRVQLKRSAQTLSAQVPVTRTASGSSAGMMDAEGAAGHVRPGSFVTLEVVRSSATPIARAKSAVMTDVAEAVVAASAAPYVTRWGSASSRKTVSPTV